MSSTEKSYNLTAIGDEFVGSGKEPGIFVWRIEKLLPVPWPKEKYGQFLNGDAFIVLQTKVGRNNRLMHDIYFWIGSEADPDEIGAVAIRTCELGNYLGGFAPHHREIEGYETSAFLSLFKDGFQIVSGGIESAFRKVERDNFEARLLHLKGSRNVRVKRVDLTAKSLNHGDVFILDYGKKLYVWNGKEASKQEKAKGLDVCQKLRSNEKKGDAELIFLDDGKNDQGEEGKEFWTVLNGTPDDVLSAEAGGNDAEHEQKQAEEIVLYEVTPDKKATEVARKEIKRSMLQSDKIYLLTTSDTVYIWVGTKVATEAKRESFIIAQNLLTDINKPFTVPIERIVENAETSLFKDQFVQWSVPKLIDLSKGGYSVSKVAGQLKQEKVELSLNRKSHAKAAFVPDEGTVNLKVYRIENFRPEPVPEDRQSVFFAGDSYVITLSCKVKNSPRDVIFMWQGHDSSTDEKGTSAYVTKEFASNMIKPSQIRIVQGHETLDFLQLFNGTFVVRSGGVPSGWNTITATSGSPVETKEQAEEVALFQVKGYMGPDTRTYQVPTSCSSLNGGDTFVLITPDKAYVWYGKLSNEDERKCGKKVAELLKAHRELVEFEEGSEEEAFFTALGGKTEYVTYEEEEEELPEPRLFHCHDEIGVFRAEEIDNFSQDDLNVDDVMILDAYDYLYIWWGNGSNQNEKDQSMVVAKEYLAKKPDGRDATPIVIVKQGEEPPEFTQHFPGWVARKEDEFIDPYQLRLKRLSEGQDPKAGSQIQGVPQLRSRAAAPPPKEEPQRSGFIQGMPVLRKTGKILS